VQAVLTDVFFNMRILPEMTQTRLMTLQWLLLLVLAVVLLRLLGPVLTPFVAAAILAYICHPMVTRLSGWKLSRTAATLLVMVLLSGCFVLLLLILMPLMQSEANLLMERLPVLLESLRSRLLPYLQQYFDPALQWDANALRAMLSEHLQQSGSGMAKAVLPWLGSGSAMLLGLLVNLVMIPLAMFYLLRDWPQLLERIDALLPRRWHAKTLEVAGEVDAVLAEFLRGQVSVMLLMSAYYALGLWIAGLQFALPIGIVTGMLIFIPYLGMATGLLLATLVALTQFGQLDHMIWVWCVFALGQMLEGFVVTPRLVGERIGLHPLAVIFALLAFGHLFGFFGVLLALPLSAMLLVGLRHLKGWYLDSDFYRK
jgi:predicted PurR-regulated permease PerM